MQQYDPSLVLVTFLGTPIVGYTDGTFVEVERNEDTWTIKVGADGEVCRVRNKNRSGRFTFTLMQSSPSNDVLSLAVRADELKGVSVGPTMVKDNGGRSLHLGARSWVVKPAAAPYGKELADRQWVIETDVLDDFVAGSN